MIEVAGMWEDGWNVPLQESVQWEMMLREYDINTLNMTPVSGISVPWGAAPWVTEYKDMDELLEDKPDLEHVFVTERSDTELSDFNHPENALYVFGRANQDTEIPEGCKTVKIAPGKGCLWAHQACAVVLYDRFQK